MRPKADAFAFPSIVPDVIETDEGYRDVDNYQRGMSLRDYFAAQALVLLPSVLSDIAIEAKKQGIRADQAVASFCYKAADAMLAERAK